MLFTQSGECVTEVGQVGVETFNNSIAKRSSITESLVSSLESMSSQEAYEIFALGFVSSGLVTAPSTFSKAMGVDFLSPVLSKFIEEEKLDEYVINQFKKSSKLMSERNDIGSIIKDFDEEGNVEGFTQGTELIGGVINGVGSLRETMFTAD